MFLNDLELIALPKPDSWALAVPLMWFDPRYGAITVPKGFVTDLASTPFHVDDNGPSRRPAVVHDAGYDIFRGDKLFWDSFLRDSILAEGGGWFRAQSYYRAVRLFGGGPWGEYDEAKVAQNSFRTLIEYNDWKLSTPNKLGPSTSWPIDPAYTNKHGK